MRVALVCREYFPSRRAGGIATYMWELANALSSAGHDVTVIAASDDIGSATDVSENGVRVIRLAGGDFYVPEIVTWRTRFISVLRSFLAYRSYRRKVADCLDRLLQERGLDLVEFAEYGAEYLSWARRRRAVPWVVRFHGSTMLNRSRGRLYRWYESPLRWYRGHLELSRARDATAVSACSNALAAAQAGAAGLRMAQIVVIPNMVPLRHGAGAQDASAAASGCSSAASQPRVRVFSAGTVVKEKGFGDLVEAISQMRNQGIDATLTIAGKKGRLGRDLDAAHQPANEAMSWLKLPGPLERTELFRSFTTADIVVFPSWWEPFGLVCIEAMASKALVVGSSAGGMREIIEDGVNGFLAPPKDHRSLAQVLLKVISMSPQEKDRFRTAAVERIRLAFSSKVVVNQQIEFYLNITQTSTEGG